jgi:septum formation protein
MLKTSSPLYNLSEIKLILGSQSPRRREILGYFSLPFETTSPDYDEELLVFNGNPIEYAQTLAKGKGDSLSLKYKDHLILTADTIVYKSGKIYGKPNSPEQAFSFLKDLSGDWHQVFTAVHLIHPNGNFSAIEETKVLFNDLSDSQIHSYYQSLPYSDKAGGYGIQGAGGVIVKRIEGCYYNVMGLPINSVRDLFKYLGIDLWDYLT